MSRRGFLRLLGIAAAGTAAACMLEGCTAANAQHQQASITQSPEASPGSVSPTPISSSVPARPSLTYMTPGEIAWQLEQIAGADVVHAIAPHPDDAISAWSLLGRSSRLIVNLMTQGAQSVHCAEHGGIGSGACKAKRTDSWLAYFISSGYDLKGVEPQDGYMMFEGKSKDGSKSITLLLHDYPDQGLTKDDVGMAIDKAHAYSQSAYNAVPTFLVDASYKYAYDNPAVAANPAYRLYRGDYQSKPHPDHLVVYEAVKQYVAAHQVLGGMAVNGPTIPAFNTQMWVSNPGEVLSNANADGSYGWLSDSGKQWKWGDLHELTGLGDSGQQNFDVFALPPTRA